MLNNDTWPHNGDWLLRMMEHAQRPEVGLVGAKLMFPEGMRGDRPQHEGIVMGMAGLAYNIDLGGYMGMDQFVRNTSGVTAACVMLRPVGAGGGRGDGGTTPGGLQRRRLRRCGSASTATGSIYTPHAVLEHPESASRGTCTPSEDEEWLVDAGAPRGRYGSRSSARTSSG